MLGARFRTHEGVAGTSLALWAPHARGVRVIGDFNGWDGTGHALRRLDETREWELFVPDLQPGGNYKSELRTRQGAWVRRAAPTAQYTEVPSRTASVIRTSDCQW